MRSKSRYPRDIEGQIEAIKALGAQLEGVNGALSIVNDTIQLILELYVVNGIGRNDYLYSDDYEDIDHLSLVGDVKWIIVRRPSGGDWDKDVTNPQFSKYSDAIAQQYRLNTTDVNFHYAVVTERRARELLNIVSD